MGYVKLVFLMLFSLLCQLAFCSSLSHLCPKDQALALLQFKHMFTISYDASVCLDIKGQSIQSYTPWNKARHIVVHGMDSLFELSNLKRLNLSYNDFSGSLISPKFGELSSLTHLDLSFSRFRGLIPAEISHLSKLHVLSIKSSLLRFEPHNFELLLKNLTQLRELYFDSVNISSTIPLNFSSYLTTLHLRRTQLYGTLPEGVFHLSNLETLDLLFNPQLTVSFPTTKWNSSDSLMELDLSTVNVTGGIPESFGHLTSLRTLRIASCNLSGFIPKSLWNLTNIEVLYLEDNHFEGPISDFFRFGKIRWLSLRNNNFNGKLEFLSFNRWTQLAVLDCSINSLTGPIPSNVSGMQNLYLLRLSSNHLNGTIPSWIFSLPSLETLNLSDNHLSGNIQEFKSKTLDFVSLKQNQLQGPIPKSLLHQQNLFDDGVPQGQGQGEEGDSSMISWQAVLMGYGCGLVIGLSIIYIMLSTQYPAWFSRMDVELEHKILTRIKRHKKRY
ncbi:hypothetical protein H5410_000562 [Solanum commersonii]|uniref:Uncharacterized protein n=1 Tax=Solanum commersonii TaxID=4109 RepID=A0A9J6AW78_SOLCO|nr:hypothetical protein H5410_000562 [Solanum commersonii]